MHPHSQHVQSVCSKNNNKKNLGKLFSLVPQLLRLLETLHPEANVSEKLSSPLLYFSEFMWMHP